MLVSVASMPAIAALGDVDVDLLLDVDRYPISGEECFATDSAVGLGGSAVNTAVVLATLGFDVGVLAQVGDDAFGAQALARLTATGVDVSRVLVTATEATGMNVILVDPAGERTMIGLRGANRTYPGAAGWEEGCRWLHLSAYALLDDPQRAAALAAIDSARAAGIPISADIPSGVAHALGPDLLPHLDEAAVVTVGRQPLAALIPTGDPVARLLERGVTTVAVTDADQPFRLHREGQSVMLTPPAVDVVDATGAGDSFMAGMIAAAVWGLELGATATLAASLGAAATLQRGAGDGLVERRHLDAVLDPGRWPDTRPPWLEVARKALAL